MISRVPPCPDCGEPGKSVKGEYYRCPNCRAVWKERNWESRLAKERARREAEERAPKVSCIANIDDIRCDGCGRIIKAAEKYCYCYNSRVPELSGSLWGDTRGTRHCVKCSLRAGYMRMVRNTETDRIYPVLFRLKNEEFID